MRSRRTKGKKSSSRYVMFVHFYLKALKTIVQSYAKILSSEKTLLQTLARCRGSMTFCRKSQNTKKQSKIEQAAEANLVAIPKLVDQIVVVFLQDSTLLTQTKKDEDDTIVVGKTVFLCLKIRNEAKTKNLQVCISKILDGVSKIFSLALKRERSSDTILSSICESIYDCWSKQESSVLEIALLKEIALGESPYTTLVATNVLTRIVSHHTTQRERVLQLVETASRRWNDKRENPFSRLLSTMLLYLDQSNPSFSSQKTTQIVERSCAELESVLNMLKQKRWNESRISSTLRLLPSFKLQNS